MEDLQAQRKQASIDKDIALEAVDKMMAEIDRLDKEIADSEVTLRHGDYGVAEYGDSPRLYVEDEDEMKWCSSEGLEYELGSAGSGSLILGNIFDDLKAIQEPLKEFEIENTPYNEIEANISSRDIYIYQAENCMVVRDIHTLIQNLRRMEATMKAKAE